jgi:hypothetical protein
MPYIKRKDKYRAGEGEVPISAGELNYALTRLIINYLTDKGKSYQTINDCIGALEGCKLEFYRRVVVPYEDKKIEENGDVFPEE